MKFDTKLTIEILLNAIQKRVKDKNYKFIDGKNIYEFDGKVIELYYNSFGNLKTVIINNKKSLFLDFDKFNTKTALNIINNLMDTVRKIL
jgi:hypothetical protein